MPMYNLIEYNKNYKKATGSFWNCYRDQPNIDVGGENNNVNYPMKDSKFFAYKTSITGKLEGINTAKDVDVVMPLKHFSNFWRTLDMPLVNCEIDLILLWYAKCVLTNKATRDAVPDQGGNPAVGAVDNPANATFQITDTKLYVPVVILSTEDGNIFFRTIKIRI